MGGRSPDPKKIITKLHVDWGHASAHQPRRVLVDSVGEPLNFAPYADEVLEQCDICRACDKDPLIPVAGAATVSSFNSKLPVGLLFSELLFSDVPGWAFSPRTLF